MEEFLIYLEEQRKKRILGFVLSVGINSPHICSKDNSTHEFYFCPFRSVWACRHCDEPVQDSYNAAVRVSGTQYF
jgi:hypothetical protein